MISETGLAKHFDCLASLCSEHRLVEMQTASGIDFFNTDHFQLGDTTRLYCIHRFALELNRSTPKKFRS